MTNQTTSYKLTTVEAGYARIAVPSTISPTGFRTIGSVRRSDMTGFWTANINGRKHSSDTRDGAVRKAFAR